MMKLITPEVAAKLLGISVRTLAAWRSHRRTSKSLPFVKVGSAVRYRVEDIEAWLAQSSPALPNLAQARAFEPSDTDLIEWLDRNADYWADSEGGTLRFTVDSPIDGFEHVRDVIKLAIAQQNAAEGVR
jgi:excisionase family DNA binding protein